jgi:hypothetical protein
MLYLLTRSRRRCLNRALIAPYLSWYALSFDSLTPPVPYVCPRTTIYVSAYYYTCVVILLCVRILLYLCPHTTIHVSSYYYICVRILLHMCLMLYMCPHTTIYVRILLRICPHTTYVSSYYYTCLELLDTYISSTHI